VFDLPERRAEVTEHVSERRRCRCGTETKADFPVEATAPACFGPAVRAAGLYLMVRHHTPVARAAEILTDLLGVPVSTGFLASLTAEAADGLNDFIDELTGTLADGPVAGADETSVRVAGAKWCTRTQAFASAVSLMRQAGLLARHARGRDRASGGPGPGVAHQPLAVGGDLQLRPTTTSRPAAATIQFQGDPPGRGFGLAKSIFPYQAGPFGGWQLSTVTPDDSHG
jgi:hypothetical protein